MAIDFLEKKVVFPQTQRERIRLAAKSQCAPKFKNPPRAKVLKVSVLFKVGESELTTCPGAAHVPSFGGFSLELFVCQLKRRQYANHGPPTPHAPPLLLRGSLGFPLEGNGISFWQLIYPAKSWTFNTRNFFRLQSTPHFKIRWKSCLRFEKSEKKFQL